MVEPGNPVPAARQKRRKRLQWPALVVILLLLGQIAGYVALVFLRVSLISRESLDFSSRAAAYATVNLLGVSLYLGGLILLALVTIFTILFRRSGAWTSPMLVQGLSLILGFGLYFGSRPFYTYLIMLYSVIVVIYLVLPGVQAAFVAGRDL